MIEFSKSNMNAEPTVLNIPFSNFVLVSDFGFRVWDFGDRPGELLAK